MPLYDFECPHGHRFDHFCSIADRVNPVPCEGTVNQLVLDDDLVAQYTGTGATLPDDLAWVDADPDKDPLGRVLVRKVPCVLRASQIIGPHNNPGGMLDHGSANNRDAAREGRYDPANPSRRFMTKGRAWRK